MQFMFAMKICSRVFTALYNYSTFPYADLTKIILDDSTKLRFKPTTSVALKFDKPLF